MAQGVASNASTALLTLWTLASVTFMFLVLRLYTRIRILKMYGIDDHCYNAAFVLFLVYNVLLQLSAEYGFGRDVSEIVTPDDLSRALLYEFIGQTLLITANVSAKLSIAFFLSRLVIKREHQVAIWTPAFAFSLLVMVSLLVLWFSCEPTAYLWDRRIDGHCDVNPGPAAILAGAFSVFVDLWYVGFPWYMLYSVNMSPKEKGIIASSMSLGIMAAACGIKRTVELSKIGSPNYTINLIIWHAAELSATMIGISIPVCLPFYRDSIARMLSRGSCSCCSNEQHNHNSNSNNNHGEIGVFGMHTIGGTPYSFNAQEAPAHCNKHTKFRFGGKRITVCDYHSFDRSIFGNTNGEHSPGLP
ncbi:hypothetical protein F5Y03DRAFT_403471 [Xylaria venustula]|nr:hypothetical protein F5Y03DRAFT_403471 [Xylaria venustula]